ncbi:MAG TPA: protein kinase [Terriglobales bacterium]
MALASGTRLGPYEIESPAGSGGMGEVYRARDTRLNRAVAVKILPAHLSERPEAKERFDREARAISSLSHPNICHLYDVGQADQVSYLVMEYLTGETLADRLLKGPLPLDQVLKCGTEICEGLEKAHRSGVVHRDLKPGNIMLTKSGAKLMDFGLAKPIAPANPASSGLAQTLASSSHPLTAEGMVVGTFQYMSPEQIEGREADARSDIFGLGAVLYEMVTGRRAFEGKTTASTIAAILAADPPPISLAQPLSPPALERAVKSCLTKDPDERFQTAHDVMLQQKWIAEGESAAKAPVAAGRQVWNRLGWLVAGVLLLIVLVGTAFWWIRYRPAPSTMYFNGAVPFAANNIALSPDGRNVALVAFSDQANKYMIWIYPVGGRTAVAVPGSEDASHPFWSPDNRSVAFFAQGKLMKVDTSSGRSPQVLCDAPHGRGGAWNRDGVIIFTPDINGGLYRVSSGGGVATEVTKVDPSHSETSHRWPVFLPDGKHFLYLAANFGGEFEKNAVYEGSLDSGEKRFIVAASSNVAYADPGYLLYVRDNALVAQRFDLHSQALSGEPRTVSDGVQYFPQTDLALFDVSGKGMLVLQSGRGADKSQLVWFNRSGKQLGAVGPPGLFANPSLSPDGRRVAYEQTDKDGRHVDIWIHDLGNDSVTRVTFGPGLNELPVWSPDGKILVFSSNQKISWSLSQKNADGSGPPRSVTDLLTWGGFWDWSHDGKYLLMWKKTQLAYMMWPDAQLNPIFDEKWIARNGFRPTGSG